MATLDTTPFTPPPHAVTMWIGDHDIYVLLPMTRGGAPYVMAFPNTSAGLASALEVLRARPREVLSPTAAQPANYTRPANPPQVKVSERRAQFLSETTEEQRARAQALIKKLGLVKP